MIDHDEGRCTVHQRKLDKAMHPRLAEVYLENVVPLCIRLKQRAPGSKVGQHHRALWVLQGLPVCQHHAKSGQHLHRSPGVYTGSNPQPMMLHMRSGCIAM